MQMLRLAGGGIDRRILSVLFILPETQGISGEADVFYALNRKLVRVLGSSYKYELNDR